MKLQDLRDQSKSADRSLVEKAFAETYKMLPKAKKEEADQIITDILQGGEGKKKPEEADVPALIQEIKIYLENAYAQNYFAPNRIIPKNKRPKWRFLAKNYIKELERVPGDSPYYADAVRTLRELYEMLCYACNYYLFSTEDPFRSVGIMQTQLCSVVINKVFSLGYTRENIRGMIHMVTTGGLDRETLYAELQYILLGNLKTSDVKYMAMEECKSLVGELESKMSGKVKRDTYALREEVNNLCKMNLMTGAALCEYQPELEYYFLHYKGNSQEGALYTALDTLDMLDDTSVWIETYEYGVRNGIKPREWLQMRYSEMKAEAQE